MQQRYAGVAFPSAVDHLTFFGERVPPMLRAATGDAEWADAQSSRFSSRAALRPSHLSITAGFSGS